MKLEYIAPYLPYGLKAYSQFMNEILEREVSVNNVMSFVWGDTAAKIGLRPLSDITKPMANQDKITWIDYLWFEVIGTDSDCFDKSEFEILIEYDTILAPYKIVEYLFSQHFDVFRLIDRGLAIDINTIK